MKIFSIGESHNLWSVIFIRFLMKLCNLEIVILLNMTNFVLEKKITRNEYQDDKRDDVSLKFGVLVFDNIVVI